MSERSRDICVRWGKLMAGLIAIWTLVFVVGPAVERIGPVGAIHDLIREQGIEATGLVYTEVDEFAEAEMAIRESLRRQSP